MTPQPTTLSIPLHCIDVSDRLRPVDEAWVEALAASMDEQGLDQAIVVRPIPTLGQDTGAEPMFALVAGAHRYAAAQRLGWIVIRCEVHALDNLQARIVEIDENLMRRELGPLDRALFLAERKRVWEELHPETKRGGDRRSKQAQETKVSFLDLDRPDPFWKEAMKRTGLSRATVMKSVELAAKLSPEAIDLIRGTSVADNAAQLKRLAKESADDQLHLAGILAEGAARNVQGARILAEMQAPPEIDPQEQIYLKLTALYARANAKTRRRFAEHLRLLEKE